VPKQATDSALVRVTAYDHQLNTGSDVSDSTFRIADPNAGVGPGGRARLALAAPRPDPSAGAVWLGFTLPARGHVRLDLHDLAGRRVWSSDGDLEPGEHGWLWSGITDSGTRAHTGLYFLRLVTPWGTRTTRLVRLR